MKSFSYETHLFFSAPSFYSKGSSGFLRQDSQSLYCFGKIQNVRGGELPEKKKKLYFIGERFRISHTVTTNK